MSHPMIGIRMSKQLKDDLQQLADADRRTLSAYIRAYLEWFVENHDTDVTKVYPIRIGRKKIIDHFVEVREKIYKRDGYKCLKCGRKKDLTIDHILAQSKGGGNNEENLQTLCKQCNTDKGRFTIDYRKKPEPLKSIGNPELDAEQEMLRKYEELENNKTKHPLF